VLVGGSGKVFCSGADLSEATTEGMEVGARRIVDLQRLVVTLDKPVVTICGDVLHFDDTLHRDLSDIVGLLDSLG